MNARDHRISICHLIIGVIVCMVGAWSSHGNLVSANGLFALFGALNVLLEIPHVTDRMVLRQNKLINELKENNTPLR